MLFFILGFDFIETGESLSQSVLDRVADTPKPEMYLLYFARRIYNLIGDTFRCQPPFSQPLDLHARIAQGRVAHS
jgi:hypothetical protein